MSIVVGLGLDFLLSVLDFVKPAFSKSFEREMATLQVRYGDFCY